MFGIRFYVCYCSLIAISKSEKTFTDGVSEFGSRIANELSILELVDGLLQETETESQRSRKLMVCLTLENDVKKFRALLKKSSDAAEKSRQKCRQLAQEWEGMEELVLLMVRFGKLNLLTKILDNIVNLTKERNELVYVLIVHSGLLAKVKWGQSVLISGMDTSCYVLSKLAFLICSWFTCTAFYNLYIHGMALKNLQFVSSFSFFLLSVFLNEWPVISVGKCTPSVQIPIARVSQILYDEHDNFLSTFDNIKALQNALKISIYADADLLEISSALSEQPDFVDPRYPRHNFKLLTRAEDEIQHFITILSRLQDPTQFSDLINQLRAVSHYHELLIRNISTFVSSGVNAIDEMIYVMPLIYRSIENFQFGVAHSLVEDLRVSTSKLLNVARLNRDDLNSFISELHLARGNVEDDVNQKERRAYWAGAKKWAGYAGTSIGAAACLATGGVGCVGGVIGSSISLLFGLGQSEEQSFLIKSVKVLDSLAGYLQNMDQFLQRKALKMAKIHGRSELTLRGLMGLDNIMKEVGKETTSMFRPILGKPVSDVLKHHLELSDKSLAKIKSDLIELGNDIKRYAEQKLLE